VGKSRFSPSVAFVQRVSFPAYRGGPMFWAENEVGLPKALAKIKEFSKLTGERWFKPSPLLGQLVAEKKGFASIG
jgi:3-hydroxyacyl-CoA dehydrogenase